MTSRDGGREGVSHRLGGELYTSAIHILQYGRGWLAGQGVAYRRHADVRRSANDWSIVTRRFSLRPSLPSSLGLSSPSRERDLHARAARMQILSSLRTTFPTIRTRVSTLRPAYPLLFQPILKGGSFYILLRDGGRNGGRARDETRCKLLIRCSTETRKKRREEQRRIIDKIK